MYPLIQGAKACRFLTYPSIFENKINILVTEE